MSATEDSLAHTAAAAVPGFMDHFFIAVGIGLLLLMLLVLVRGVKGPSSVDRMIAVNAIGTKATVLLVVIGFVFRRVDMFVDLALTYALLNFIGSLAAARLVRRRKARDIWRKFGDRSIREAH